MANEIDFDDFEMDADELGSIPSYDAWNSGEYTDLQVELTMETIGKSEANNLWKFARVRVTFTEDSEAELLVDGDSLPKAGDYTDFQYDLLRTDKETKEEYACGGKHVTPDGTVRNAGGLTRLLRDFGDALEVESPKDVAEALAEGVRMNLTLVRNVSNTLDANGSPRINQYLNNAEVA